MSDRHIILMGFKHVGKTSIGRALAERKKLPFYELDRWVEDMNAKNTGRHLTCREIVKEYGEVAFRAMESEALLEILERPRGVIDLGGGAVMTPDNQIHIKGHQLVHVTAPQEVVFDRISESQWPQLFSGPESPEELFQELWAKRKVVYEQLALVTVDNDDLIETAVQKIMEHVK